MLLRSGRALAGANISSARRRRLWLKLSLCRKRQLLPGGSREANWSERIPIPESYLRGDSYSSSFHDQMCFARYCTRLPDGIRLSPTCLNPNRL